MGRKRAAQRSKSGQAAVPPKFGFRPARRSSPPPADGNIYREIVQDRIAARFGQDAVKWCWSMGLPDKIMLDSGGPVHQALDRLDDLRLSKVALSKTAERAAFLALVKQWQQGYLGRWFEVQEGHRKVGRKAAAASRRQKQVIDDQRAQAIVDIYRRVRPAQEDGHAGDIEARRIVLHRWEAANGEPITDRTIRNILDAAGVKRNGRRPRSGE